MNLVNEAPESLTIEKLRELIDIGADLSGADLSRADLSGADLIRADLRGADLSRADLSGADLIRADLSGADLSRADLRGADLSRADLSGADLSRADLSRADLRGADLSRADLSGADLRGADLSRADLSGADLSRADLSGADLRGADLSRADLSGAEGNPAIAVPWHTIDHTLPRRVAEAASKPGALRMDTWHTCETTHCLAGWAIHLSGPVGAALEALTSPSIAGSILMPEGAPLFYADNKTALAWCHEQLAK